MSEDGVAIITGGSRRTGFAIAERLLEDGWAVVITGRRQHTLDLAVTRLGPERAYGVAGHSDDRDHQERVVDEAVRRFGPLTALVNNAAVNPALGPVRDLADTVAEKIRRVYVLGSLSWARSFDNARDRSRPGATVQVPSYRARRPTRGIAMYGVSKATAGYPLRRLGEPRDVAAAVAFLVSSDATWLTGVELVVDGGLSLTGGAQW